MTQHEFDQSVTAAIHAKYFRQKPSADCVDCRNLMELYSGIANPSDRQYWLATELFVKLHDGRDFCEGTEIAAKRNESGK